MSAYSQWVGTHWIFSVWKVIKIIVTESKKLEARTQALQGHCVLQVKLPASHSITEGSYLANCLVLFACFCELARWSWHWKHFASLGGLFLQKKRGTSPSLIQPAQAPTAEGQHGQGECPSWDAVNAIYCWQAKKNQQKNNLRRNLLLKTVDFNSSGG